MAEKPRVLDARERRLGAEEFRDVLVDSGLGAWRPVDDLPRLEDMLRGANITVTARLDDASRTLVGGEPVPLLGPAVGAVLRANRDGALRRRVLVQEER